MTPTIVPNPPVASDAAAPPPRPASTPSGDRPALGVPIREAVTRRARLRGLLGLREPPPFALRLAPCRSVHTFGMRFALDLHWLDASGRLLRVDRGVPPGRVRSCRRARAVVEVASILGSS